ncbi:type II toxin-antitoxin system VapC family toxin [Miltoncostaea marina]|uniref:type II toxin-antitoxin system VapC family toxin n=1 Tax=Miltoncostaea marina TaxID=2843215 RepID=UPI001C3C67D2|nr:type II toxin-antitoxin system VapC family toxin [Miltoncostaea marina]
MADPGPGLIYADTSAIVRAYMPDEPDHALMRAALLDGDAPVATSALAELELTSAMRAAHRAGRLADPDAMLDQIAADASAEGPLILLALDPLRALPRAQELCDRHPLRALDALHLAVALDDASRIAGPGGLAFATCDRAQAEAARAEGLAVL